MNEIGVFICNYNKADYVVECVEKVLNFKKFGYLCGG